jgi:hypothetical protein
LSVAFAPGEWPSHADPWPPIQRLIGAVYLRVFVFGEQST